MNVNRIKLLEALSIVKPGLANKEQIEQSTSFAFVGGYVKTYNDEISISHPVEGLDLEGVILAETLYSFLNKTKEDEIIMKESKNEIVLTTGKATAGLTLQTEVKLPFDEDVSEIKKFKSLPENFLNDLSFVAPSCTKDMSQPILTAIHVNEDGYIEGSDGYHVAKCELGEQMPVGTFLLPANSALEVAKLSPTKIAEGTGWIHFKTEEGTIISCRILADDYPSTSHYYKQEGERVILPKNSIEILERAMVFAKRKNVLEESVILDIYDGEFKMSAKADGAWFKERQSIKYDGEQIRIDITPYLLKRILAETREFYYTKNKLTFRGERWFYVTTLRHIKE